MKILIVANHNPGCFSPFVIEQAKALKSVGVEVCFYGIVGRGIFGYLKNIVGLKKEIEKSHPDLIHAHYGLSGLCANLQRAVPVVTTYHGSDIHSEGWILKLSQLAMKLSAYNIFVSNQLYEQSGFKKNNCSILPCGIDMQDIISLPREDAKRMAGVKGRFVLFSGSFANSVKNFSLANAAMKSIHGVELVELRGFSRQQVNLLMNAADCLLMTSHREGSPQVIKEAMACGTPIVSVDVGDVGKVIGNTDGCFLAERNPNDISAKIELALAFQGKTTGRQRIIELGLDSSHVAKKLKAVFQSLL